uniref:Cyclin-like domain-containing protein n=2 Tax=Parascaris univalens TaxID=6257 RepID=A0A915B7N5_PARUN
MKMAGTDSVGSVSSSASSARQIASVPSSSRWIFTQEELMNTPSIREGMHPEEELKRRRAAAQTIHQMADRLNHDSRVRISQLCICAAMMHMHRFFVFHSFYKFDPRDIAAACLFLAGKSEECPRKLEHIVRVWWAIKFPHTPNLEASRYHDAAQLIVTLENVILQTIAFDLSVDIPHTFVLNHMQNFARGSRKISEIAYWFASDMLHMTNWGVRFPARSIACVCIHLACLWAQFEIQMPPGSPPWYETVDPTMTANRLLELGEEFSHIYKTYGEQLNIKKYAMRNSVANASQASQGQVRRNSQSQSQSQAPSSSLASLPPPPPAPELNSGAVKVETKTEPARRIDLSDYKQRTAGGITASTSAQNASQSSGQRRNFMQPDVVQSAAIVKASGDFDLPLPPAIANEKKTLVAPPEQEVRQKRRADEPERENIKHRRVEKSEKAPLPEGQSSQHRKRTHERTATNVHHEGTPVATNAQHEGTPVARPSGHHSVPGGYSSANSGTSSSSRHHEGGPSSAKKPKQAPPLAPLVPPPPPPTGASSQPPAPAQRISSSLSSSASQPRSSSHGTESSHRSSGTSSSLTHETYSSTGVSSMSTPLASSGHRHSSTVASSSRIKSSRECVPSAASLEMANGGHSSSVTHAYSKRPPRPTTPPLPPPASIQPNRNVTTPSTHQSASYSNHDDSRRAPMEVDGGWVTFCNRFNNRGGHRGSFGGGGGCYRGGYRGSSFRSGSGYYRGGNRPPQNFSRLDHSYSRSDRFEQQSTSPLFGGRAHRFRRWSNGFGPGVFSSAFEEPPQECRFNALSGFGSSSDGNTSRMLSALPPPPPPPPNDELEDGEVL